MKEYFLRFITGRIGVYWSFFNHFILVYILGLNLLLWLDYLKMIDDYPNIMSYGDFWCMRSEEAAHPLL